MLYAMLHAALSTTSHRPWPLPQRPWVLSMTWHDLLFQHWPVPLSVLRPLVPAELELETFDGSAWIGVIPFTMDVRPRGVPRILASRFPEVNARTYVRHKDKSGVWFFSLDAAHRLTVWGARRFFYLPYHNARMSSVKSRDYVLYYTRRKSDPEVRLDCRYHPIGDPDTPGKGTLEHWLTERYCLFSLNQGRVYCGEIQHPRWMLQAAASEIRVNTITRPLGFDLPARDTVLHFSKRQDVVAWMPKEQ